MPGKRARPRPCEPQIRHLAMYDLDYTERAWEDFAFFRKYDQRIIQDAINRRLRGQPNWETRQRIRLRPNALAEWELRAGDFRVFYDVLEEARKVKIIAIGYKQGNKVFIRGEESEL